MESMYFKATPITADYHYGMLGEFKVIIRTKDMYLNITKLCSDGGKNFFHWKELKHSQEVIKYYNDNTPRVYEGLESCIDVVNRGDLTTKGVSRENIGIILGTYIPCEMAITVAQWVSVPFGSKVARIVVDYYNNKLSVSIKEKDDKIDELTKKIDEMMHKADTLIEQQNTMQLTMNKILSLAQSFKDLIKPETGTSKEIVLIVEELDGGFSIRCGQKLSLRPYMKKSKSYTLYENISNSKKALRYLKDNDILPRNDNRTVTYKELDQDIKNNVYEFFGEVDKLYKQEIK